jgi:hypothetical protein
MQLHQPGGGDRPYGGLGTGDLRDRAGRFYYRGVGLKNGGLSVEIDDPVQTGAGFVATNNGVQYSVSPGALLITQSASVLSNEPMLEYWSA